MKRYLIKIYTYNLNVIISSKTIFSDLIIYAISCQYIKNNIVYKINAFSPWKAYRNVEIPVEYTHRNIHIKIPVEYMFYNWSYTLSNNYTLLNKQFVYVDYCF